MKPEAASETVEFIARTIAENYVFEDRAKVIAEHLRARLRAGAYRDLTASDLAEQLQSDVRSVDRDRHLEVAVERPATGGDRSADRFAWLERLRNRNYDFTKLERLVGNVGYLELNSFPPPEVALETARAAMTFVENSRAVIIDLRNNGGGTGNMSQMLASYFFVEHVRLLRTFRRAGTPQITDDYTLPFLEGKRMPATDLYVLVSSKTFSAAEAFAFSLQQRGRATVVGETTRGGANAGRYVSVPNGLRVFIPLAHASSPVTDRSWDDTGVIPDLSCAAADALAIAHSDALTRILKGTLEDSERRELETALAKMPVPRRKDPR